MQSAPAASSNKKKEEEDVGPPMTLAVSKEQRVKDEKAMKVCHSRMLVLVMGNQLQFSIDPFKINFIHSIEIASLAASQICFDGSNCNFTQKRNNLHNSNKIDLYSSFPYHQRLA